MSSSLQESEVIPGVPDSGKEAAAMTELSKWPGVDRGE